MQQRCSRAATAGATEVQQRCNRDATELQQLVQQRCNKGATEMQQRCNSGPTALMLAKRRVGGGWGGQMPPRYATLRLRWRRWGGPGACWSRRRWWRLVTAGRVAPWPQRQPQAATEMQAMHPLRPYLRLPMPALSHTAADGEPQVARPSRCRRRRSSLRTHELPPSPRPAAALPLPPAVG